MINITIWNEFRHEKNNEGIKAIYPEGMHKAIGKGIQAPDFNIRYATLDEPEHGLTQEVVNSTDVMFWWGHLAHGEVSDAIVERVHKRVLEGMGLIVLHSGHFSKIFRKCMGTNCSLEWREASEKERIWTIEPSHPIAAGLPAHFELPHTEMYGERFDVPQDGENIFITWYEGGNVFRSGLAYKRGHGKVFYFAPGHETFPIFYDKNIVKVLSNAARWAHSEFKAEHVCPCVPALEEIRTKPEEGTVKAGVVQSV